MRCRALHEEANPAEARTLVQPAVLLQPRLARLPPRAADEGALPRRATAGLRAVPVSFQDNTCALVYGFLFFHMAAQFYSNRLKCGHAV